MINISQKYKWGLYVLLLVGGLVFNFHKYIVEAWMLFAVRNQEVVISMSTTPHRINHMRDTITSILNQSRKPQAIYVNIPYLFKRDNLEYVIPDWMKNNTNITILRSEDYGPATKILGLLEQRKLDNSTIVITLDDDIIYPKNLILQLAYKAYTNPGEAIGIRGSNLMYDQTGKIDLSSEEGFYNEHRGNYTVDFLQGYAGIAYRAGFFNQDIFQILQAPRECINSDDIYLSFYLALHNIPRRTLKNRYMNPRDIISDRDIGHQDDALHNLSPKPLHKHAVCVAYLKGMHPEVKF